MYVEKRNLKGKIKYYLVYSYRKKNEVKKIRKYLGQDLTKQLLEERKKEAEHHILELLKELNTEVFLFTLTKKQIEKLNNYDKKIRITNLDKKEWQRFTEEFVYNTNAIEGSSVERDEVPKILHNKKASNDEELETKGVAKAVNYIKSTKDELSTELIKKLHKICFHGSKSFAGKIRNV